MSKCIAPHKGNELELVISGVKPLAIIYKDKQPNMYEEAFYKGHKLNAWKDQTHFAIEVRKDVLAISVNSQHIRSYVGLVSNRKSYTRAQYQRCMGKLLDYSNHDIEEFIISDIGKTCTCVECGGTLK